MPIFGVKLGGGADDFCRQDRTLVHPVYLPVITESTVADKIPLCLGNKIVRVLYRTPKKVLTRTMRHVD